MCHFSNILVHFVVCQLNLIVKYYHILFIIIVFRLGCDRPSGLLLFAPAVFFSILTPLFCVSSSVLFRSCCSHAQVFGKTLVHKFSMSYSHTEWNLPFSRGEIVCRPKLRLSKSNLTN